MGIYMHSDTFTATFLPVPTQSPKPRLMPQNIVKRIRDATSERDIAEAWMAWLNPATNGAKGPCPGYRLGLSQDRWDAGDLDRLKVDGALYLQTELPDDGRPHWELVRSLWEFKKEEGRRHDPFDDSEGDGKSEARTDVRGQVTSYVGHSFAHQHRTAIILFIVTGTRVRVTRWDRSGTIFTQSFDYLENRELLRDILWGFSLLEREQQGFDTSATVLTPADADYQTMDEVAAPQATDISSVEGTIVEEDLKVPYTFRAVREAFRDSIKDTTRFRLTVPTQDGERSFLVGKPTVVAPGMSGRGTRGFIAWDPASKQFVFLKDAWRPNYENVDTEGKILRRIQNAGVKNIPTYVCDGELNQCTVTPEHAKRKPAPSESSDPSSSESSSDNGSMRDSSPPAVSSSHGSNQDGSTESNPPCQTISPDDFCNRGKNIVRHFRHYRIVVEEVCLPLCEFKTGKQLISVIRDCVEAHAGAVSKANVIHRDISAGNMLICPTVVRNEAGKLEVVWKGMLTDWELSKLLVPTEEDQARQPVRTGTWQFASAYVLDNPEEPVTVPDEIESMFHVTLYNGLRYLRHTCTEVQMTMFDYFDQFEYHNNRYCCNADKRNAMETGRFTVAGGGQCLFLDDNGAPSHPINWIIGTMLCWFPARYAKFQPVIQGTFQPPRLITIPVLEDKLKDHSALLSLLDEQLKSSNWPKNDKVGDQLAGASSSLVQEATVSEDPQADQCDGGEGSSNNNNSENRLDEPSRKRARTHRDQKGKGKGRGADDHDIAAPMEEGPSRRRRARRPEPVRTRGSRNKRGTSSRTGSAYNLRRTGTV